MTRLDSTQDGCVLTAHVSVAVSTGLSLPYQSAQGRAAGLAFSAAGLSGAATSASITSVVERPDLVVDAQASLGNSALRVERVQVRERDVDGSTVLITLAEDHRHEWDTWASTSDHLVEWAHRAAAGALAQERRRRATALWSHTVLICSGHPGSDSAGVHCDEQAARAMLPTDFETVVQHQNAVYLGLHASLVCVPDDDAALRVVELIDELHGWWTASWLMDQSLLDTVMSTSAALANDPVAELVDIPDVLAQITNDVGTIRARIDTFRIGLGGLEWPVWEAATRRWELGLNLDAVATKRHLLLDMHGAFLAAMQSRRAERLNQIAGFFAAVSSVASLVAVIVFLFPTFDHQEGHLTLRVVVTAFALAITSLVLLWSSRLLLRRHRSKS